MEDYPQWTDPQVPLPSGKMPTCRYSTPIRILEDGWTFLAPLDERRRVRKCAERSGREIRIEKVSVIDCRVTVLGPPVA